ncbi:MAG: hypothetical protein C4576_10795 [Desulfobacteraceae bacterium]|nr:MAG: hypothetical protein C4576_10795 [Desulfobacteraceae bacterium]
MFHVRPLSCQEKNGAFFNIEKDRKSSPDSIGDLKDSREDCEDAASMRGAYGLYNPTAEIS